MNRDKSSLSKILGQLAKSRTDEEAWASLYRQMWPFVIAIFYRQLGGIKEVAEDAAQDVFLRLVRSCPFGKLQNTDLFRAYVRRVAQNVARTYRYRFLKRAETEKEMKTTPEEAVDNKQPLPEDYFGQEQLLRNIIAQLDETDRQLIRLLAKDLSLSDVAKATGLTYTNAGVRLHRLRRKLRDYLIS
jgi:RNA polymerase sigma-70 factor (ECF subfamily)